MAFPGGNKISSPGGNKICSPSGNKIHSPGGNKIGAWVHKDPVDASADQNIPNRRPLRDKSDGSTLVVAGRSDVKAAPALLIFAWQAWRMQYLGQT